MRRRDLLGMALWATSAAHAAEPDAALATRVRERLADAPVLRGRFEQRRSVNGFKHPLVSRGDFVVARGRGVLWLTREPFESSIVVTRERLRTLRSDGGADTTLDARQEPGLRAVNEMLFALMSADLQALAREFRFDGEVPAQGGWRLRLTPRGAALARWLAHIELEGERFVRVVRVQEAGGDASLIRFDEQTLATELTPAEGARLE